jgi:hypothetical protein
MQRTTSSVDHQMDKLLLHLRNHLPEQYTNRAHAVYVKKLLDAFEDNYASHNYQFAYIAFHMLMMIGVYVTIWQIKHTENYYNHKSKKLIDAINKTQSPFAIAYNNEKQVLALLDAIGCSDKDIQRFIACVEIRNNCAHSNGILHIPNKSKLCKQCRKSVRVLTIIQNQSRATVKKLFINFVETSIHAQTQSKKTYRTRITNDVVKKYYFSSYDIELLFRIKYVFPQNHPNHTHELRLRNALARRYGDADPYFQGKLDRRFIAMMRNLDKLDTATNSE